VIYHHAGENRHLEGAELLDSGSGWLSPACPEWRSSFIANFWARTLASHYSKLLRLS